MALDMRGWDRETCGEEEEVILSDSHPGIHSKETQVKELFGKDTFIRVDEGLLSDDLQTAREGIG